MNRTSTNDRRCKVCGARLTSYNRDTLCYPCQEKEDGTFEFAQRVGRKFSSYSGAWIPKAERQRPFWLRASSRRDSPTSFGLTDWCYDKHWFLNLACNHWWVLFKPNTYGLVLSQMKIDKALYDLKYLPFKRAYEIWTWGVESWMELRTSVRSTTVAHWVTEATNLFWNSPKEQ